jgi:integrase
VGFDRHKKIKGRKRHLLVDTLGLIVAVVVTAAHVDDRQGLTALLNRYFAPGVTRLRKLWVDGGYHAEWLRAWVWGLKRTHKIDLVPLHPTTRAALEAYLVKRTQLATADEHVFVSLRRRPLSRTTVYPTFTRLLAAAGVPCTSGRSKPRLIDLRHTFATNVLLASPASRDHIGRHMLALTTYLGHAHVSSTYWYLESSPQLMGDIAQACERFIEENTP